MVAKRFIRIIFSYIAFYCGAISMLFRIRKGSSKVFIFMYHNLSKDGKWGLPFKVFRSQVLFLKRHFDVKPLEEAASMIRKKVSFKRNIAVITFDDGYLSFSELAKDFLVKHGVPTTVFLAGDCAGGKDFVWTDKIRLLIDKTDSKELNMQLSSEQEKLDISNPEKKEAVINRIKESLKSLSDTQKNEAIASLTRTLNAEIDKKVDKYMLTWPLIKKINDAFIDFGAHTVTHPILTKVSLKRAESEIADSKRIIETNTDRKVTTFCYPNGKERDYNDDIEAIVEKNGFVCACSAVEGANTIDSDLFALKRISTYERHLPIFAAKLFFKYIK